MTIFVEIFCVLLASDDVFENEFFPIIEKFSNVILHFEKMNYEKTLPIDLTTFDFILQKGEIRTAAERLSKKRIHDNSIKILGLACTSMSFLLGKETIENELKKGFKLNCICTDMAQAQAYALKVLNVKNIALLTPYLKKVACTNIKMLEKCSNVSVVARYTLNLSQDYETSSISQQAIADHVTELNNDEVHAFVIGCSAFKVTANCFIDEMEALFKKPVVTSLQAFLWYALRLAKRDERITGFGTLFSSF